MAPLVAPQERVSYLWEAVAVETGDLQGVIAPRASEIVRAPAGGRVKQPGSFPSP